MVEQAEIHQKSISDKIENRRDAVDQFRLNFAKLPDKDAAWQDLIRLAGDEDSDVRKWAASTLGFVFPHVHDKETAWQDLHRLTDNNNRDLRLAGVLALTFGFIKFPDKNTAWQDLIRLIHDEDRGVRAHAVASMDSVFPHISDKKSAWQDLYRLTCNEDHDVRVSAALAIESVFPYVPDKGSAWRDLNNLTSCKDDTVRLTAVQVLGIAFLQVPDKESAWLDLYRVSSNNDVVVRFGAACALGDAFCKVPDEDAAWRVMVSLSEDCERDVRVSANHSLGRASVFRATETKNEEEFRQRLETALEYFEKSAAEAQGINPAKFCLPFYRSFYVLTCKNEISEVEVEKYLKEAKDASEGSKSKEDLLEAVANLSKALKETQRLREKNLYDVKRDLKVYSQYCNRFAELLESTKEKAPRTVKLLRIGGRRVDNQIKDTITEIQQIAKELCKTTVGTGIELLGREVNQQASEISTENYLRSEKSILRIADILEEMCDLLSPQKREHAFELIKEIHICCTLEDRIIRLEAAINYIQPKIDIEMYGKQFEHIKSELDEIKLGMKELQQKILDRLGENEKTIISAILDQSDQEQMDKTLDLVKQVLSAIQHQELQGPVTSGDVEHLSKVVDDTRLKAADKLKVTLPIIPYLLQYEHEITLEKGMNLSAAWDRLVGRAKGKR